MKKYIIAILCGILAGVAFAANDGGDKTLTILPAGTLYDAKISGFGSKKLSIYNTGSVYVYANVNSSVAQVRTNLVAGLGMVPIAAGTVFSWEGFNIVNVAICTGTGETGSVDIANYNY